MRQTGFCFSDLELFGAEVAGTAPRNNTHTQSIAQFFGVGPAAIAVKESVERPDGWENLTVTVNGNHYDCSFAEGQLIDVYDARTGAPVRKAGETTAQFFTRIRCK
jgi:hypothetical protein